MTIREAFANAGYPVPDCARIQHDNEGWSYLHDGRTWLEWWDKRRFYSAPWSRPSGLFDLSNLPAIDAYDLLPASVQKVVKPA